MAYKVYRQRQKEAETTLSDSQKSKLDDLARSIVRGSSESGRSDVATRHAIEENIRPYAIGPAKTGTAGKSGVQTFPSRGNIVVENPDDPEDVKARKTAAQSYGKALRYYGDYFGEASAAALKDALKGYDKGSAATAIIKSVVDARDAAKRKYDENAARIVELDEEIGARDTGNMMGAGMRWDDSFNTDTTELKAEKERLQNENAGLYQYINDHEGYLMGWGATEGSGDSRINSSKNAAARVARYEKNQKRIEEIDRQIGTGNMNGTISSRVKLTDSEYKKLSEERARLQEENRKYENTQLASDRARSAVNREIALAKERGEYYVSINGGRGTKVVRATPSEIDALSHFQDGDYEKYYDKSSFLRWWMGRNESGTDAEVTRDWQDEAALQGSHVFDYEYLTENEIQNYFWILHTAGAESAEEYLSDMIPELNRRSAADEAERIDKAPALAKILLAVASHPARIVGGVAGALENIKDYATGQKINPYDVYNRPQVFSENVVGSVARDIDNITGGASVLGMSAGDVYQSIDSWIDSVAGAAAFGPGYAGVMGLTAATSEMRKLYDQGASDDQVIAGGIFAGIAETAFEYISLDKVFTNISAHNIINVLKQAGIEASEEVATEIANTMTNAAVMGSRSDMARAAEEYMQSGLSEKSAWAQAWADKALEVYKAGAGGFISGGLGTATLSIADATRKDATYTAYGRDVIANDNANNLTDFAARVSDQSSDIALQEAARGRISRDLEAAKDKGTTRSLGKLAATVQSEMSKASENDIDAAIKEAGLTGADAEKAKTIFTILDSTPGFELNNSDLDFIQRDDVFPAYQKLFGTDRTVDGVRTNARYQRSAAYSEATADRSAYEKIIPEAGEHGREVAKVAERLGEVGKETVTDAYNAGKAGEKFAAVENGTPAEVQKAAYKAGKADAAVEKANVEKYGKIKIAEKPGLRQDDGLKKTSWTSSQKRTLDDLGKELGTEIRARERGEGETGNGYYDPNDASITIFTDVERPVEFVMTHEAVHRIADVDPDAYNALARFIQSNATDEEKTGAMLTREATYGKIGDAALSEEVVSDFFGKIMFESGGLERAVRNIESANLTEDERGLIKRALDAIFDFFRRIIRWANGNKGKLSPAVKAEFKSLNARLVAAESRFTRALQRTAETVEKAQRAQSAETKAEAAREAENAVKAEEKPVRKSLDVVSPEESARYMELAKDPEKNEAELSKMVEEAARAAGYPIRAFHGTGKDFNAFDRSRRGSNYGYEEIGFFFTSDYYEAKGAAEDAARNLSGTERVIDAYLKIEKPHVVKTEPDGIDNRSGDPTTYYDRHSREINEEAASGEYDGVIIEGENGQRTYIIFDPAQAKSADPVTYDDRGNVIPLEERFNPEKTDIRWSRDVVPALEEYRKKYGTIPAGERPVRDIVLPKKTEKGLNVAQTARTILESKVTPDTLVPTVEQLVAAGVLSFESITDEAAMKAAQEDIDNKGFVDAFADWQKKIARGQVSKFITAEGWALYNAAATAGDAEAALTIIRDMVGVQRSAAQALQATRILKTLSPEAQLYNLQRSLERILEDISRRYGAKNAKFIRNIEIDPDLAEDFLNSRSQEERDRVTAAIYRQVAMHLPTRFIDRWNAWRYLGMLGNLRTHVRNIAGNLGFAPIVLTKDAIATGIEAAVSLASRGNLVRTKSLLLPTSSDNALFTAAWKDYANVKEYALGEKKFGDTGISAREIERERPIFGNTGVKNWAQGRGNLAKGFAKAVDAPGKALEKVRVKSGELLDLEDVWFSMPHYAFALAQYCKANGITAQEVRNGTSKRLEAARRYAALEAQKATYRDANEFSNAVSSLGRLARGRATATKRVAALGVEGLLPFRRTPANILVRGLEYSPLAFLKMLTTDIRAVRLNALMTAAFSSDTDVEITQDPADLKQAYTTTGMTLEQISEKSGLSMSQIQKMSVDGKWVRSRSDYRADLARRADKVTPMTGAEMIDHISAGLTGTGLMLLGFFLARAGILRGHGSGDDEEKKFEEQVQGRQAYSLQLGDVSISLDWLAPETIPTFIGVNLAETAEAAAEKDKSMNMSDVFKAIARVSEPLLEMSALEGVNNLYKTLKNERDMGLPERIAASLATSYLMQGMPTLFGQIKRGGETERKETFIDKNSWMTKGMQYTLGKAANKLPIPNTGYSQVPYIDAWGRTESNGNVPTRLFNNLVNPAFVKNISRDETEAELLRLYNVTGSNAVLPSRAGTSFKADGVEYDLTPEQYITYATARGSTAYAVVSMMTKNPEYAKLSDDDKAKVVSDGYMYADRAARRSVNGNIPIAQNENWIVKAMDANKHGITPDEYILVSNAVNGIESIKDKDGKTIDNSEGLLKMRYIYSLPDLTTPKKKYLIHALVSGKKIVDFSPSEVNAELKKLEGKKG